MHTSLILLASLTVRLLKPNFSNKSDNFSILLGLIKVANGIWYFIENTVPWKVSWFADGNYQYDFFMYAKSVKGSTFTYKSVNDCLTPIDNVFLPFECAKACIASASILFILSEYA